MKVYIIECRIFEFFVKKFVKLKESLHYTYHFKMPWDWKEKMSNLLLVVCFRSQRDQSVTWLILTIFLKLWRYNCNVCQRFSGMCSAAAVFRWIKNKNSFLRVKDYLEKMSSKIQSVPENVANGLQTLRTEQRSLASKLSELQMDLNEHK